MPSSIRPCVARFPVCPSVPPFKSVPNNPVEPRPASGVVLVLVNRGPAHRKRSASASRILGRPCTGRALGDTAALQCSSPASGSTSAASIFRRPAPARGSRPPRKPSCRTACPCGLSGTPPTAIVRGSRPTFSGRRSSQVFLHHSARPVMAAVCTGGCVQPGCFQRGRRSVGHQPVVGVAPAARAAPRTRRSRGTPSMPLRVIPVSPDLVRWAPGHIDTQTHRT